MNIEFFSEPELEFGSGRHIDIRFGIMNLGPVDVANILAPKEIKIGVVGTTESISSVVQWLERCRREIPAKKSKQPNLFPKFPGFSEGVGFYAKLILDPQMQRSIPHANFDRLKELNNPDQAVEVAVNLFLDELTYLQEKYHPQVYVCAVPQVLLEISRPQVPDSDEEGREEDQGVIEIPATKIDFHDLLKARAMRIDVPLQIILPSTYGKAATSDTTVKKKRKKRQNRLQDEATRAWNIHTALYYKASGVPWRLPRQSTDLATCYIGISFYKTLDNSTLLTSVAQVFNERGEGVIVRGGTASYSKDDRQVHLAGSDAEALLENSILQYKREHFNFPARLVVHKSSSYTQEERDGFLAAARKNGVELLDLLAVRKTFTRLFRAGQYPPLRGTFLSLDDRNHILYTRGSVDFFSTYPGLYVPRPLLIQCELIEQTPHDLAHEILALSKMNWNNTQFDGSRPITLRAAEEVSRILRYIQPGDPMASSYRFYM